MTSIRQIEANRRNALRSTGPKTDDGKRHASQNAVRHGLTAETVIVPLEDADDYRAFEQAVTADYDAETAVERELILRLASLLWRLRRATSIETGLLQIEEEILQGPEPSQTQSHGHTVARLVRLGDEPTGIRSAHGLNDPRDAQAMFNVGLDMAWRFLRLADLDNGVFDRLGRYESALWRQVRQTLFTLEGLRWRTSNASRRRAQHSWQRTMNPRLRSD
jgi:hypothetical protein